MTIQQASRWNRKTLVVALWLSAAACATAEDRGRLSEKVGVYHWGGRQADGVASGIRAVLDLHGSVVRVAVSPRMAIDYNRGSACIPSFQLAGALEDEELRSALADPRLKVLIMTTYGGTGFTDCVTPDYLNPRYYSEENTARIVAEYSDFVYRLHVLFQGSGKRFILANWEGDNAIYCGEAYGYVVSEEFRKQCDEQYPQYYAGNRIPQETVEGMVLWHRARYQGVKSGIDRARAAGLDGIEVQVAVEISGVHELHDHGLASVLYHVLPRVPFDYVSYSSWESLGQPDPAAALASDLGLIQSVTGSNQIIVGEMGFSRSGSSVRLLPLAAAVTQGAIDWGASYVIYWNLYDWDTANDFGLFDFNGKLTDTGSYLRWIYEAAEDTASF